MEVWLQGSDFSSRDLAPDADTAIREMQSHDWADELQRRDARRRQGEEACDAGIGFVREDGQLLHVCPAGTTAVVHYHRPVRVLGFMRRTEAVTHDAYPITGVPALVRRFYSGADLAELA